MASNKRKQDEKHLKTLREMVALPINKQCFDCHQRGPTYVNMTIGSFVCTSCSGILRGLNPPHRVKSISMASFTPEEMDFLKSHGNELNRKVYLGLCDSRSWPEPDSRNEQMVRDYMVQKYENKRWYVAPTEAMKEDAKRANEAALVSKPQAKPLRSMLGENASRLVSSQAHAGSHTNSPIQPPPVKAVPSSSLPPPVAAPNTAALSAAAPSSNAMAGVAPPPPKSDGFDLLGELGGDPFASNTPAAPVTNNAAGGFADFSNFGSFNSPALPPSQPTLPQQPQHNQHSSLPPNPAFPISNTPLVPMGSNSPAGAPTHASVAATQNKTPAAGPALSAGDRYAALADLDSAFSAPTTTAPSINWGGNDLGSSGGGVLNWGGSSGNAANPTSQSTPSSMGWGSNNGGSAFGWNSQPGIAVPSMGSTPASAGFGAAPSTAANPFGTSQAPSFSTPVAVSSSANPFGVASTAGFGAAPVAAASPFQAQSGQFGQFPTQPQQPPMQNGGFGMPPAASSTAGFGASPGMGMFPGQQQQHQQQAFMMQQQHQQHPQAGMGGGWGAMGAPMGTQQPQQQQQQQVPSANPFMSAALHQHVPPPSGATNPFL